MLSVGQFDQDPEGYLALMLVSVNVPEFLELSSARPSLLISMPVASFV